LQSQDKLNPKFNGAIDCLKQTIQKEGIRGLFKGMSSPVAGAGFINAILFTIYGQSKNQINEYYGRPAGTPLPLTQLAAAGAFAGFINCIAAGPIELVKTQMQVQYNASGQSAKYLYGETRH